MGHRTAQINRAYFGLAQWARRYVLHQEALRTNPQSAGQARVVEVVALDEQRNVVKSVIRVHILGLYLNQEVKRAGANVVDHARCAGRQRASDAQ